MEDNKLHANTRGLHFPSSLAQSQRFTSPLVRLPFSLKAESSRGARTDSADTPASVPGPEGEKAAHSAFGNRIQECGPC